jgi:hypothetical protein
VSCSSKREVWDLVERLMNSILAAIKKIDELAPEFPDEWVEARDQNMEGLQVGDYMTRLAEHSQIHHNELASVCAAIGRSRPTDPGDSDPNTEEPYAKVWYQWRILEAFLRRVEMVSELIGLNDEDLDKKPPPELVAGNDRSVREICEHVLHAQKWIMSGIQNGISEYRKNE